MNDERIQTGATQSRPWRDLVVFQGKLLLDGLRDAVLIPLSLIAALLDLVFAGAGGNRLFYRLLEYGRRSEAWINLFGAARDERSCSSATPRDLDELLGVLESTLADPERRRALSEAAQRRVQSVLRQMRGSGQ